MIFIYFLFGNNSRIVLCVLGNEKAIKMIKQGVLSNWNFQNSLLCILHRIKKLLVSLVCCIGWENDRGWFRNHINGNVLIHKRVLSNKTADAVYTLV